jgi:uncharacterized membrane-anchored protein
MLSLTSEGHRYRHYALFGKPVAESNATRLDRCEKRVTQLEAHMIAVVESDRNRQILFTLAGYGPP